MSPNLKRVAAVGLVAAGLLTFTASPASATSLTTVRKSNDSLVDDLNWMSDAASTNDSPALSSACSALSDDAEAALAFRRPRAVPRNVWSHMRGAWTDYAEAATLCISGADNLDPDLIDRSTTLLHDATGETTIATRLLKASRG